MTKVSPLAPNGFPDMPAVPGVRLAAAACGAGYGVRSDLMLAVLDPATTVAGVLTTSATASAPVTWCRRALRGGTASALVVNAGNANTFTGRAGHDSVQRTVECLAGLVSCPSSGVFVASTGVIGEPLADEKITDALPAMMDSLSDADWRSVASAIMTTDTYPKGATRRASIGGGTVTINGIAKGSGMIAPNMATMLAFVFTDAAIPSDVLTHMLKVGADKSFNSITVDGDTSTSDTLLLFATGRANHKTVTRADDPELREFRAMLGEVLIDLAQQVVRDGEGATKFITITVTGAESEIAARRIGLSIANSPLVKTAIAGEDANWGRIVMAVGKAGEKVDQERLAIRMGGVPVASGGAVVPGYDETPVARHLEGDSIDIGVDVGVGRDRATVWTCDLTHGYIDINADYRS